MLALDREAAIAAWRRAEARVYPSVMVNVDLYRDYIGVVRAVADLLGDVRTEDELVAAYEERRELVREAVSRDSPPMLALMDLDAVRDAAFSHRHREVTREQGKALAAHWAHMVVHAQRTRAARLVRPAARRAPADVRPGGGPARPGRWRVAARQAAGHDDPDVRHPRGMGGAHRAGARPVRKGLTVATHPKKIIDAHCHIGEIPPWKYYDLEHPVKSIVYDYPTPKEFLKNHMDYF